MLLLTDFFNSANSKNLSFKPVTIPQITIKHFFMAFTCYKEMAQLSFEAQEIKSRPKPNCRSTAGKKGSLEAGNRRVF